MVFQLGQHWYSDSKSFSWSETRVSMLECCRVFLMFGDFKCWNLHVIFENLCMNKTHACVPTLYPGTSSMRLKLCCRTGKTKGHSWPYSEVAKCSGEEHPLLPQYIQWGSARRRIEKLCNCDESRLWGAVRKSIISDRFSTKTAISAHI